MKASTQQWLEYAKADLVNCERILDDEFLTNIVAFHSQQAVEKRFKALFEENDLTIPRIHSLIRLCQLIEGFCRETHGGLCTNLQLIRPMNINELEHRGLDRCPDRGFRHFERYIWGYVPATSKKSGSKS